MLKRSIKYTNFNDEEVTEDFYFNISKPELIDLEVNNPDGIIAALKHMLADKDPKALVEWFRMFILMAYGEKSSDGRSFVKTDEIREAFSHTAAYQQLFMELAQDDNIAADFLIGVLPKDLVANVDKEEMRKAANAMIGQEETKEDSSPAAT